MWHASLLLFFSVVSDRSGHGSKSRDINARALALTKNSLNSPGILTSTNIFFFADCFPFLESGRNTGNRKHRMLIGVHGVGEARVLQLQLREP